MRRYVKWVLVAAAVAAVVAAGRYARRGWDPALRDEVETVVAVNLLLAGASPELVEPLAACMVAGFERDVPEAAMRRVADGQGALPASIVEKHLRTCACVVVKDPQALGTPGYCGSPEADL